MERIIFIKSAPEAEAEGNLREIYEGDRKSAWPEVLQAWRPFRGVFARTYH
jgi:hypothetical protein